MIYTIIRIVLGLLFVVSGWVKAVDPMGTAYKITDYAAALHIEWLSDMSIPIAIVLCGMELFMGLMLIFKLWEKIISYLTVLFLAFFTVVTLFLVFMPNFAVKECGCFGDAFVLTNGQTLAKNILFLTLSFFYARRMFRVGVRNNTRYYYSTSFMSGRKKNQLKLLRFFVYVYIFSFSMMIPLYSALYLPPYTYLPFDTGRDLRENVEPKGETQTELIYENIATGEKKTFSVDDTEWQDETKWSYVDTKTSGGTSLAASMDLSFYNSNNEDVTDDIINNEGYTFMVVAQDINDLDYLDIMRLDNLYRMNESGKINLVVATTSPFTTSNVVLNSYGWRKIEVCNADIVELKSVLRSHKGLLLISNGVISGKWNFHQKVFNNIEYNDIKPLISWSKNAIYVYFIVVGLFVAIMLYLVKLYHTIRR